ncbi:MAG TPA: histidine kinase [Candidatus Blautia excrementipullorum]|nr:histidine kinase [Candidatus Blautia excrementipullorum]
MIRFFQKIRQSYGDMSLQSKFTIVLMLAVTIPVLMVGFFFYSRLYDMVVSYTIRQEQDSSAKTAPIIEEDVQKILDVYTEITDLPLFQTLFHQPVNYPSNLFLEKTEAREFRREVQKLIEDGPVTGLQIYMDFPIDTVQLFEDPLTKDYFSPMSRALGTYWHGIFQGTGQSELFCPSFYLGDREKEQYGDMAYITSTTFYYQQNSYQAYIAVYFSSDQFDKILEENLTLEGSVSYIMNDRNAMVAASNDSLAGIYWLDYESIEDSFMSSNNFIERSILDTTVYAGFYNIKQPGWFMVTVLPSDPLMAQSSNLMLEYVLMYLGILVLATIAAHFLSHSVTNRISSVIHQMSKVREGTPAPMDSPTYHDEVGDLIDTYNYMTRKMGSLMEEQLKAAEELRIAEFNSLQAQINPHFLYNTMDMINWLAVQGRNSEVSSAVQSLSKFYKLTLSRKESITTIGKEEEHVSIYIQLQNMRFHDRITFVSDIPDELTEYRIPKLTLQPVIENAVLHGILEKESKSGTIVLTGWLEEDDIILLISDDGVGIPPEKLSTIIAGEGSSSSGGTNIAVYNTHRRLQILYGPEYGLTYSSQPGQGTEVQIRIPAQKEYKSPYIPEVEHRSGSISLPLGTVSASAGTDQQNSVTPETLLKYGQKLTHNLYNIQNLHQAFQELPAKENFYILTHQVTEDFPGHTHSYFELNYLCSGSLINVVDGNEIYMTPGDLVFLNRKAVHELRFIQKDTLLINFCLKPEIFGQTLGEFCQDDNLVANFFREPEGGKKNYIFFSLGHSLHAQSLLNSMIQEYADSNFHKTFQLEAMLLLFFSYLANEKEFSYYGSDEHTHRILSYFQDHCLREDPDEMAGHFGCTPDQIDEHLKKHTGRSAMSFVWEIRLNEALRLLSNPDFNIYQIAENCGFDSVDEFSALFRRKFHITPVEYRKQFL